MAFVSVSVLSCRSLTHMVSSLTSLSCRLKMFSIEFILSCLHQYWNVSLKISLSYPVCLSAYSPCSWETYTVNSDCPIMLGLSGNQQGAWPQRSHSSPALLPGPAVSFCVKRKKQIDFFFLFKPRDESDVRMKINASFTPNNVQKETCVHAHHGDFQSARKSVCSHWTSPDF